MLADQRWPKKKYIIGVLLVCALLASGCSFFGKPQKKPQVSKEEIQKNVKSEMNSPETRRIIENAARTQRLEDLLMTPEASRLIQRELVNSFDTSTVSARLVRDIQKALSSPSVQKQLQEQVKKAMETPEVQKSLTDAVRKSVMQILQGGGQTGAGGAGGGGGMTGGASGGGGGGGTTGQ